MKNTLDSIRRFRVGMLMGVFFTSLTSSVLAQTPDYLKALQLFDHGQPAKAIEAVKSAADATPTPETLFNLGYFQAKSGDFNTASQTFDKGMALDPKDALNYAGKGYVAFLNKNAADAKLQFDKALSITKMKNALVLKTVAEAYLSDPKSAAQAQSLLEKAKSINADDPQIHLLLGDAFTLQNNGGSAVSSYEKAAKLDPKNATAHFKVGQIYLRSKNYDVGVESFNKAIAVDPTYAPAYKELAELYYQRKEYPKAVEHYKKYLSLISTPMDDKLPFYYFMAGQYKEANEVFKTLIQKPDVKPSTLRYNAFSLVKAGDLVEAKRVFGLYFAKMNPEEVEANDYNYYAEMIQKQGGPGADSLAVEAYRKSLAIDPKQTDIQQTLAETLFKLKRYKEAVDAYNALETLKPALTANDIYKFGQSYMNTEQYHEADTLFDKLVQMQPTVLISYSSSARAKYQLDPEGKEGLAKAMFEKVIEMGTPDKNKRDLLQAHQYLSSYYVNREDIPHTIEHLKKVVELDPGNTQAKEGLKLLQGK